MEFSYVHPPPEAMLWRSCHFERKANRLNTLDVEIASEGNPLHPSAKLVFEPDISTLIWLITSGLEGFRFRKTLVGSSLRSKES